MSFTDINHFSISLSFSYLNITVPHPFCQLYSLHDERHSAEVALLDVLGRRLYTTAYDKTSRSSSLYWTVLDLSAAFDTVKHETWKTWPSLPTEFSVRGTPPMTLSGHLEDMTQFVSHQQPALTSTSHNLPAIQREFNACQAPRSLYPSIFNRFPVIQASSLKLRHFNTFLHILASPVYSPGTIAVNVTRSERGFNVCKTPCCIYPSIFNRF